MESFWQSEGIRLEKEAIRYNAAKRDLAKHCLNSMWGKLTERNDRSMARVITQPKELYGFLSTPGIEVMNLVFASDNEVWISWNYGAEEHVPSLRHTNEVIGAKFIAGARIHLYRYLDRIRENAMYCDTDSVIYIQPRGEPPLIETGDKLGVKTSEFRPIQMISEFAYGGPKNYSYRVVDTLTGDSQTVCKLRGIILNYNASKLVNFDAIRDMILRGNKGDETAVVNVHTQNKIKRKRKGAEPYILLPKPKIRYIEFHFSRGGG